MKIRLTSLYLTDYNDKDLNKKYFLQKLKDDKLIDEFVSHDIEEKFRKIEKYHNDNRLHIGPAYIVGDHNKLVGFIRPAWFDVGQLHLHYGVAPDYRNHGYGSKILTETSSYVFKHISDVDKIVLDIRKINKYSIKAAEKAGFRYEKRVDNKDDEILSYVKRR